MKRSRPKLSILIPTYNRRTLLACLVDRLVRQVIEQEAQETVEIIISDNRSEQPIEVAVLNRLASGVTVRLVQPPNHFPSAEENLAYGIGHCTGDYVWPFGDDDIPAPHALNVVMGLVEQRSAEFFLLNSWQVDTDGVIVAPHGLVERSIFGTSVRALAEDFGFTTVLASFSSVVFARDLFIAERYKSYIAVSPIYAHVAYYIEAFSEKPAAFIAEPIVSLREGTSFDAFKIYARAKADATYAPWIKGIPRLNAELMRKELVSRDFFVNTIEVDKVGRFWNHGRLLIVMAQQLGLWLNDIEQGFASVECISREEMTLFTDCYTSAPQWAIEELVALERAWLICINLGQSDDYDADHVCRLIKEARARLDSVLQVSRLVRIDRGTQIPGCYYREYFTFRVGSQHLGLPPGLHLSDNTVLDTSRHDLGPPDERVIRRSSYTALKAVIDDIEDDPLPPRAGDYMLYAQSRRILGVHIDIVEKWAGGMEFSSISAMPMPPLTIAAARYANILPDVRRYSQSCNRSTDFERSLAWLLLPDWYASRHPTIDRSAESPIGACLAHLIDQEDRNPVPSPLLDLDLFRQHRADVNATLRELVTTGIPAGCRYSLLFDEHWYCAEYLGVARMVVDGLVSSGFEYYLTAGCHKGHSPGPYFDESYYMSTYADARQQYEMGSVRCGAEHYLAVGADMGYSPSKSFSEAEYLLANGDVAAAVRKGEMRSGFVHWLRFGRQEGRAVAPSGRTVVPLYQAGY